MKPTSHSTYDVRGANRLLPLLSSIGREIEERSVRLADLEAQIQRVQKNPKASEKARKLIAEAAVQRREIRHATEELQRFGCSVLGTDPVTIRIPGRADEGKKSFVWQTGDPVLK